MPPVLTTFDQFDFATSPSTVLLDKELIKRHVMQLENSFGDLACYASEHINVNVDSFRTRLINLDVARKDEHETFINNHLMRIDPGTTLGDLWATLSKYWNFLNFDLLEYVVSKYGTEELKHKMNTYAKDLESFRKSTRLCDFLECWPVKGKAPPETTLRKFVAKMNHDWEKCTLEDLDSLEGAITRKFFLPKFAFHLENIKKGCIAITWLIPAPYVKTLQEAIENTSHDFFMKQAIESVTVDGQQCYPFPLTMHSGHEEKIQSGTSMISYNSITVHIMLVFSLNIMYIKWNVFINETVHWYCNCYNLASFPCLLTSF